MQLNPITIETVVNAPLPRVWDAWNKPEHIVNWAFASDDWEASDVENDLRVGGTFKTVMGAKDKSASFDFTGIYTVVNNNELIEYNMDDGRHVKIEFINMPNGVKIIDTFDPETENTEELQRSGWQAILDNFKNYTESI